MNFRDALLVRHACKLFDMEKPVTLEDREAIIEFGRLSPSSFGFEPWHFLVIANPELRAKIQPTCWNQPQITTASFIVVYLTYLPYHFKPHSEFFRQRIWRRTQDEERFKSATDRILAYLAEQNTEEWAKRQSYIALANMMTGAASLGIDSCPIEGFEKEALKEALAQYVDWHVYSPTVIAAFGYRVHPQSTRIRENLASIATFIE